MSSPAAIAPRAAMLVMAESAVMLGRRSLAIEHAEGAVELLRRYGNTYLLDEARALFSRVA